MMNEMKYNLLVKKLQNNDPVVDDITIKHAVIDGINAKLQRIDHNLTGMMINQGKTIREAELEKLVDDLENENAEAHHTITVLRNCEALTETYGCGGNNSYKTIKLGCSSHAEMTVTVRTNIQEIVNSNEKLDMLGYMFGKWIKKNADDYFLSGLFKALSEGG